ncbi:uncharacterized protein LOC116173581 isoform X1 [Photinus pyralis]|uniref:uncharacterized protein LOC116173581 isoform X1 n=1 Tax=Photinus pyralis TaxID=7054 RepID=UPI0012670700|nr:uncharacterized protein LOC116173581 isoform X1 [Photinus pyralis]XP_031347044.1 uncharacterized protein LOC116173581 isoform X1 [Photinus pyralis]
MPVGSGFENSAMKASFSLSSLQASPDTPDKGVKIRTCSSLKKKKHGEEYWRRSWGSTGGSTASEQKDDFWSALQANYDYIMDNQLIDNCQEANGELTMDSRMWSLKKFYIQFSDLYSWLNSVQETLCGKENGSNGESLRTRYINEVVKKNSLLEVFNEQASQLVQLHPEMEEEVTWRVMRLNSKWESIETALGLDCKNCSLHTCTDVEHELKRLRTWMKSTETRLKPLVFRVKWSKTELENKILEHKALHRDIESQGKIVGSVVKLCKANNEVGKEQANIGRAARSLERRWHLLFLRSLEWLCFIDTLYEGVTGKSNNTQTESSDSDLDNEPLHKYPRLGDCFSEKHLLCKDEANENGVEDNEIIDDSIVTMVKPKVADDKCKRVNQKKGELVCLTPERVKCTEDSSSFTKSNRRAPNLGTYYFKHEDTTDSEVHTPTCTKLKPLTPMEDSSEDEWTYTANDTNHTEKKLPATIQPTNSSPSKSPCQDIQRLVQKAEELVRESPVKKIKANVDAPLSKMSRVKQWLNMEKPSYSCDASCEEEDKESESSEDLNESVATCRAPQDVLPSVSVDSDKNDTSPPKVLLRQKRVDLKRNRPWSIASISHLPSALPRGNKCASNFSISESALNQLSLSPKYSKSLTASANSISVYQNNSTSSTMEEGGTILVEHNSTPARRRRLKLRKKSSSRRKGLNEPCASIENTRERVGRLIKSGSFSGSSYKISSNERHTSSDPSTIHYGHQGLYTLSNYTSDAETDEDRHNKGIPIFKIGEATNYLTSNARENSPGKISLNNTEEQSSSLSEQAWDSYQEKYLSEAYSEAQDSDAARRLLEFGEDYRNFLDSQSDWSTRSTNPEFSPPFKRKSLAPFQVLDSESDSDDVRTLLQQSRDGLLQMINIYNQTFSSNLQEYIITNDTDIIATCDRHIYCLHLIEKSPEEYSLSKIDKGLSADLLSQWKRLREKLNKMQEYRSLQKEILTLKNELTNEKIPVRLESLTVNSIEDIRKDVEIYSNKLLSMDEQKAKLLTLNVAVHRFVFENKNYNSTALKGDISDLYRVWYDIHSSVTERLNQLNSLLQTWQTLENRLKQLQGNLQEDKETLAVLDSALQDGVFSNHIATSVRDVAKVLSETYQDSSLPGLLSESSYSDSGISDEGSEHEHGKRERKLASIRHLMRQLEAIMAPDCSARAKMSERLLAAEDELRHLQKRCRSLVVRTAVSAVSPPRLVHF